MAQPVQTPTGPEGRKFTGWHALAVFGGAFGVIIAVNIALAVSAVRSFPGLETRNAYVESQTFDARRAAQEALGWTVAARSDGATVVLSILDGEDQPVRLSGLDTVIARPTHMREDIAARFVDRGGHWVADVPLAPGNWTLRLRAVSDSGDSFNQRVVFTVPLP
jgi:nitrogen fixation protein FixH